MAGNRQADRQAAGGLKQAGSKASTRQSGRIQHTSSMNAPSIQQQSSSRRAVMLATGRQTDMLQLDGNRQVA